jgi:hypothetical protein
LTDIACVSYNLVESRLNFNFFMPSLPYATPSFRMHVNRAGVTYDEDKTQVLYAEDVNAIEDELEALGSFMGGLAANIDADLSYTGMAFGGGWSSVAQFETYGEWYHAGSDYFVGTADFYEPPQFYAGANFYGDVVFYGDVFRLVGSYAPSASNDDGDVGMVAWDSNYFYVCVAKDTWKRAALSTW